MISSDISIYIFFLKGLYKKISYEIIIFDLFFFFNMFYIEYMSIETDPI